MADTNKKKRGCFRTGCLTTIVAVLLFAGLGWFAHHWAGRLPGRFVLRVPVSGSIDERAPDAASFPFGSARQLLSLEELLTLLDRAKSDQRVDSVLLEIDGLGAPAAMVQELESSIAALRKSGKKVTALLNTPEDKDYRLAVACDSVIVRKNSWMTLDGLKAELFFFADPLKKLGVSFQAAQWKKYKSAVESFTRSSPSPENLEETNALLDDAWADYLGSVSRQRRISREAFRTVVDSLAVLTPEKALSLHLIDRVATERQLEKEYAERLGKPDGELFVSGRNYLDATGGMRPKSSGERIAVVAITGMIVGDGAGVGETEGTDVSTVKQALQTALDDPKVKAIVLRIDSPGGDALAASTMLELLDEAKAKKPIVASMSGVAASGGYMVALAGSKIFAEPMTVTGSIGVFALKPDFGGLLEKSGIHREVLTRGRFADAYTPFKAFDEVSFRKFVETTGVIYDDFIGKVARSRRMTPEQVDAVAGGRVWSGKRALEAGLVDQIGGLADAVREAQKLAGMDAKAKPELLYLPTRKTWLEYLTGGDTSEIASALTAAAVRQSLGELEPLTRLPGTAIARFLLRTEEPRVLALDPVAVEIK